MRTLIKNVKTQIILVDLDLPLLPSPLFVCLLTYLLTYLLMYLCIYTKKGDGKR